MVRDYFSLTGPWLYSTEEVCHAKHPQCCITDQLLSLQRPTTDQKHKGCAKSRESMNVQPITKWLLFSFFTSFLFWCSICLDPLAMKMASLREVAVWLISEVIPASRCWHGPFTVESVLTLQPCCCIHIPGLGFVPFLPTVSVCTRWLGCPPLYPCSRMAQRLLTEVGSQFHKGTDEHWK